MSDRANGMAVDTSNPLNEESSLFTMMLWPCTDWDTEFNRIITVTDKNNIFKLVIIEFNV